MKWSGQIGFAEEVETAPGVIVNQIAERQYFGDVIRDTHRWQSANQVNDNLNIDNQISIVADLYANNNFGYMKWVSFMGAKWKIKSVEVKYPRLILSIGDLYNG